MREVSTKDLKNQLSDWVRRVETLGERVVVTRSGRPVAALVPLSDLPASADADAIIGDLVARGAVRAPRAVRRPGAFTGEMAPMNGSSASEMILEDRR